MFLRFIASFAFVLQMLRAKPIPLRLHYPKAPSGRELPTKSGEGELVTKKLVRTQSHAGSFHFATRATASACGWHLGGRLFVNPIISQIGRENKFSADIYMRIRRGDLRSPAGEHSSPLPCSENILMRRSVIFLFFVMSNKLYNVSSPKIFRRPIGKPPYMIFRFFISTSNSCYRK